MREKILGLNLNLDTIFETNINVFRPCFIFQRTIDYFGRNKKFSVKFFIFKIHLLSQMSFFPLKVPSKGPTCVCLFLSLNHTRNTFSGTWKIYQNLPLITFLTSFLLINQKSFATC